MGSCRRYCRSCGAGTTMRAAGLEEVEVVMKSQAVLIANPNTKHPDLVEVVRKRIAGHLVAKHWVMITYNVPRTLLAEVKAITSGRHSPSIQPLDDRNWVAVNVLVS